MSDKKPRRFWLDICTPYGDPCDFISEGEPHSIVSSTNIEVIEVFAYDALEARIAELKKQIEDAPWMFGHQAIQEDENTLCNEWFLHTDDTWMDGKQTHRAKLVNVEKL